MENKGWTRSVALAGRWHSERTDEECAAAYRAHRLAATAARPFIHDEEKYEAVYASTLAKESR